jgi:uncharacterized protein YjbI with pentapeptide repeats
VVDTANPLFLGRRSTISAPVITEQSIGSKHVSPAPTRPAAGQASPTIAAAPTAARRGSGLAAAVVPGPASAATVSPAAAAAVNPAAEQTCGSCWAFGAAATRPVAGATSAAQAVSSVAFTVMQFLDGVGQWVSGFPANPVTDLFSGVIWLIRRTLFPVGTDVGRWGQAACVATKDCSGKDLTYADLAYNDLSGVDFTGATMRQADLRQANMSSARLRDVNLIRADLTGATLKQASIGNADVTGALLNGADFTNADLGGQNFAGITASNTNWTGARLSDANLTNVVLKKANFTGATLTGAKLGKADLSGSNFYGADLSDADLFGANLTDVTAQKANFTGADLTGANLTDVTAQKANFTGARLVGAMLARTSLFEANMTRANLTGANLITTTGPPFVDWTGTTCPRGGKSSTGGCSPFQTAPIGETDHWWYQYRSPATGALPSTQLVATADAPMLGGDEEKGTLPDGAEYDGVQGMIKNNTGQRIIVATADRKADFRKSSDTYSEAILEPGDELPYQLARNGTLRFSAAPDGADWRGRDAAVRLYLEDPYTGRPTTRFTPAYWAVPVNVRTDWKEQTSAEEIWGSTNLNVTRELDGWTLPMSEQAKDYGAGGAVALGKDYAIFTIAINSL